VTPTAGKGRKKEFCRTGTDAQTTQRTGWSWSLSCRGTEGEILPHEGKEPFRETRETSRPVTTPTPWKRGGEKTHFCNDTQKRNLMITKATLLSPFNVGQNQSAPPEGLYKREGGESVFPPSPERKGGG